MFKDVLLVLHRDIVYPSFVPYRLRGKEYPYCRIGEIVTLFQNNMKFIKTDDYKESDRRAYKDQLVRFYGDNYSCFTYSEAYNENITYAIEKVDTKRPWTIIRSDVGERIKYFEKNEKFKITDKELNYGVAI